MKPTYIGKLIINNYKSFEGLNAINLFDEKGQLHQWTIILGDNNTGKTNLLKLIADLEPALVDIQPSERVLSSNCVPYNLIRSIPKEEEENKKSKSRKELVERMVGCDIYYEKRKTKRPLSEKKLNKYQENVIGLVTPDEPQWGFIPNSMWKSGNYDQLEDLKIYAYGVTRRSANKGISNKKAYESNATSIFESRQNLIDIEEWLLQLDYAAKSGQKLAGERIDKIKELIISEMFPEITNIQFFTSKNLKNYIKFETSHGCFSLEELGYGYQTTLSWVIDLCKKLFERYPKSKNPLNEPAIVLIDELDLHLHPKWQKTIVNYLSDNFKSTQFIATTHSPLIIQTLDKVNLYILVKTRDNKTVLNHFPKNSFQGWKIEEILEEIMDLGKEINSDQYNVLINTFDQALDSDNYTIAKSAYEKLLEILHPNSSERKLLKIQLSQVSREND